MNVETLMADLSRRGIRLEPEPDGLIVEPASKLTDTDRALIRQHKAEILAAITRSGRNRWPDANRPPMPFCRCGALVCPTYPLIDRRVTNRAVRSIVSSPAARATFGSALTPSSAWRARRRAICRWPRLGCWCEKPGGNSDGLDIYGEILSLLPMRGTT
jgi:hypothetical protein